MRSTSTIPTTPIPALAPALAGLMVGLIVYASLYPFSGWRWPGGASVWQLLHLPFPPWRDRFDTVANLLGYAPLGLLLGLAGSRGGGRWLAWLTAVALPCGLSYAMEVTQALLPGRYPSLLDWGLNSLGGLLGVGMAFLLLRSGWLGHWHAARRRWFDRRGGSALVLMLIWPLGLLFPLPLPLGMGLSWERIQDPLVGVLIDVPWAQGWLEWVSDVPTPSEPLAPIFEWLGTVLGLLGPCLLGFSVTRRGWRRAVLVLLAASLGLAATTLSAAMNFGPLHALAWLTPTVLPAIGTATVLALLMVLVPARLAAAFGMMALSAEVMLVAQAPADPYFALSLQAWEQGRFIHFHGLAQWLGWAWPFVAMLCLAQRVSSADPASPWSEA